MASIKETLRNVSKYRIQSPVVISLRDESEVEEWRWSIFDIVEETDSLVDLVAIRYLYGWGSLVEAHCNPEVVGGLLLVNDPSGKMVALDWEVYDQVDNAVMDFERDWRLQGQDDESRTRLALMIRDHFEMMVGELTRVGEPQEKAAKNLDKLLRVLNFKIEQLVGGVFGNGFDWSREA